MPALEPLPGWRVVASPAAIDGARWTGDGVVVLRSAPDEAFAIGATGVELDDPDAIATAETGVVGARLSRDELDLAVAHVDWRLPAAPGVLAQGKIGGVPAKVLTGEPALLLTQAAYAHELAVRLGWLG